MKEIDKNKLLQFLLFAPDKINIEELSNFFEYNYQIKLVKKEN